MECARKMLLVPGSGDLDGPEIECFQKFPLAIVVVLRKEVRFTAVLNFNTNMMLAKKKGGGGGYLQKGSCPEPSSEPS